MPETGEVLHLLSKQHIPKVIYIREISDVIRQLSSVGMTTFQSSHKSPYGDTCNIKTLSENEYRELWESLRNENMEQDSPACKGPVIFVARMTTNASSVESKKPSATMLGASFRKSKTVRVG